MREKAEKKVSKAEDVSFRKQRKQNDLAQNRYSDSLRNASFADV